MSTSAEPQRTLTRRAALGAVGALGAGVALVSVSGCDLSDLTHDSADARPDPAALADRAHLAEAIALSRAAVALLEATARRHPGEAGPLAGVLAMHRAQLRVLDAAGPADLPGSAASRAPAAGPGAAAPRVAVSRSAALRTLADLERGTRQRLTGLAQRAHSGELARILASMAAAISQRLEQWPA